ncbi:MAG: sRNA-binding carbon storage regulator CsrA [Shewanella sp.]|jgi:sRNA-binding carbon storage regulator CsrA
MLILTRSVNNAIILNNIYDEYGNSLGGIEIHIFKDNRIGVKAKKSIDVVRAAPSKLSKINAYSLIIELAFSRQA